ncbi:MAG: hypothetical protein IPG74_13400 [Flavobacteriales bacterium]|nr:hypothetical protein [Flavobacteriales bacterium]
MPGNCGKFLVPWTHESKDRAHPEEREEEAHASFQSGETTTLSGHLSMAAAKDAAVANTQYRLAEDVVIVEDAGDYKTAAWEAGKFIIRERMGQAIALVVIVDTEVHVLERRDRLLGPTRRDDDC